MSKESMKEEMQRVAFTNYAEQFGLKPEWLGKKVTDNGKTFTVVGLNINSKQYPVVTKEGVSFAADYFKMLVTGNQKAFKQQREKELKQKVQASRKTWHEFAEFNGLKKSWLDQTFYHGKHTYTIVGLEAKRTAKVVTSRQDGRTYFWPAEAVIDKMKSRKAA